MVSRNPLQSSMDLGFPELLHLYRAEEEGIVVAGVFSSRPPKRGSEDYDTWMLD